MCSCIPDFLQFSLILWFIRRDSYIKRETAQFFGVDEETETAEKQRWLDRRRRMASRKYGALVPEHRPPDPDITRDVPDTTDIPEVSLFSKIPRKLSKFVG